VARAAVAWLIAEEEFRGGRLHIVATVTGDATRRLRALLPTTAVPADQVVLFFLGMTLPAYVYRLSVAGKGSSVATVTGRAGRSFQVLLSKEGNPVNAILVQLVLVSENAVRRHPLFVGVTAGTGGLQVCGVNTGPGIIDCLSRMTAVAVEAGGHVLVPLGQELPVRALFVFAQLVDRQPIREHPLRVGMTGAA
jgi:hypothetical protein